MFFKLLLSLIRELCTAPKAYRKPDIQATIKRNMAYAIVKQPEFY